jgi:hypothetical protein
MEYRDIVAATTHRFEVEERDIEARQAEVDGVQPLLDRRRKALKRKRVRFERLIQNIRELVPLQFVRSSNSSARKER